MTPADDDEPTVVRPGEELDWGRLAAYLRRELPELDGEMVVRQFLDGAANLTYLASFEHREFIIRRPPFGQIAPGAHDMRREFRVLSTLCQAYDRAPRAFLLRADHDVLGADFVVMERRLGTVIRDVIPPSMRQLPDVGTRLGFAVVDAMADLHLLSPADCGLDTLGRPEGFLARQLAGWHERWDRVRPPDAPPALDEVPRRLAQRMPAPQRVSILHNDLKLDNCQFQPGAPDRVTAVFDWDMATLGDPLVDLGTLLNYWPDPTDPPDACRANIDGVEGMGLPSRHEVTERYVARTGFDASEAGWYEAFAQWKTAIVVQQLHDRYSRGETADKRMVRLGARMPVLANSAMKILDEFDHSPN